MVMNPRLVLEQKLFTMSIYTTYWKYEFFQRHLRVNLGHGEKYVIMTQKVCISAKTNIQKKFSYDAW